MVHPTINSGGSNINILAIGLGVGFGGAIFLLGLLVIILVIFKKKTAKSAMNVDPSSNSIEMFLKNPSRHIASNVRQISYEEIQNILLIGKGNFSEVYKGYWLGTAVVSSII